MRREKGAETLATPLRRNGDSYSQGHDGFCCVQLSIFEDLDTNAGVFSKRLRAACRRSIGFDGCGGTTHTDGGDWARGEPRQRLTASDGNFSTSSRSWTQVRRIKFPGFILAIMLDVSCSLHPIQIFLGKDSDWSFLKQSTFGNVR